MSKINITSQDWYFPNSNQKLNERTKSRLTEINDLGLKEVSYAQFGIPNVMSGLYIEMVWHYSDDDWNNYIDWIKSLLK